MGLEGYPRLELAPACDDCGREFHELSELYEHTCYPDPDRAYLDECASTGSYLAGGGEH